ncbi:P-loop containing nucleoside triphosphate hydrolase protein, partial [Dimargaris cristalligena]
QVSWADIGGLHEAKRVLEETVCWFDKHENAYRRLGISPRRGVLLHGPPGTGKTLLAKAVATQTNANFLPIRMTNLIKGEIGDSEKAVRQLFRLAQQSSPCVIFIDELETLFGNKEGSGQLGNNLISQLLLELDQLNARNAHVVVLGATNYPDGIDQSILRPGRLDKLVYVAPPGTAERREILQLFSRHLPIAPDVDWEEVVHMTDGLTGADLQALVNKAGLLAL